MSIMKKPVLLVVSFGTSFADALEKNITAIEKALAEAFPEYEVRRAFTSGMILKKLRERDGIAIDSVPEAMERLVRDGVQQVVIQPTHFRSYGAPGPGRRAAGGRPTHPCDERRGIR